VGRIRPRRADMGGFVRGALSLKNRVLRAGDEPYVVILPVNHPTMKVSRSSANICT
jgi:hypothetical protein